jgi:6-pyruvoyltetrahydropterin/6-carboxytetrahydropterin synthase
MSFRIVLDKENFKFSCSHFTIFSADAAERLHGHNYYVSTQFTLKDIAADIGMAFDFGEIKPIIRKIVDSLDERVLVPLNSPHLRVTKADEVLEGSLSMPSIRVQFARKVYIFPSDDVFLMPCSNITSEELARWVASSLATDLNRAGLAKKIVNVGVGVQETRGQSVWYDQVLDVKT